MTKIWDIPSPIYDLTKNAKPYLWPDQKLETLFMTWPKIRNPIYDLNRTSKSCFTPSLWLDPQFRPMLNYRKHNLWRAFVDFLLDNDEEVASRLKNIPISRQAGVQKPYLIYDQNGQNQLKSIPYLWPKTAEKPYLYSTSLYSQYKGVLPGLKQFNSPQPAEWTILIVFFSFQRTSSTSDAHRFRLGSSSNFLYITLKSKSTGQFMESSEEGQVQLAVNSTNSDRKTWLQMKYCKW